MPRFNTPVATVSKTTNLAGGDAFHETAQLEFASTLLTSMVGDQFYRSGDAGMARLTELLDAVPPLFAAKAAVLARNEYGMRSISHVVAGELAMRVHGETWTRAFYDAVVRRPDDITEIISYIISKHGRRPLPNALKDGLARAFGKFDSYALAKYRAEGKAVTLVDAVNLVHPKPNERNAEALKALVDGSLRSDATWEAKLSAAGQAGEDEDVAEAKSGAWGELIRTRQIGYFALLRNLRNIMQQAPDALDEALALLVDESMLRRSLVLPFRFQTAAKQLEALPDSRKVLEALSKAAEMSLANVPTFDGKTLIVVDVSGSMVQGKVGRGETVVADVAALFAAVLYKRNDADLMLFANDAAYANVAPDSGVLGLTQALRQRMNAGGTNFAAIFPAVTKAYDRVVILSDMQGWMTLGVNTGASTLPTGAFEEYVQRVGKRPIVYSFDLQGLGTLQFPQAQVYCLAGFSDRVFEVMGMLDGDKDALVHRVEAVQFA